MLSFITSSFCKSAPVDQVSTLPVWLAFRHLTSTAAKWIFFLENLHFVFPREPTHSKAQELAAAIKFLFQLRQGLRPALSSTRQISPATSPTWSFTAVSSWTL